MVLLVLPEHWPRALLRAELVERGYDAVGVPDLATAVRSLPVEGDRRTIRLIVVDQAAVTGGDRWLLDLLVSRHGGPPVLLLAHALGEPPPGPWRRVVRRPALVGEIAAAVEEIVPRQDREPRERPETGGA